ncbi:MAG: hypothetical protein IAF94_04305 [Pirellulaceae bacterium]|nr:hypothetical protein [Pirellulaceae bacterium]
MASEIPVVRYLLICREVLVEANGLATLRHLLHIFVRPDNGPFPCVCEQLTLYGLLTSGRGKHRFGVELALFEPEGEMSLWMSPAREIDLGRDPVALHALPIPIRNIVFPQPGQYVFRLLCDQVAIAEAHFEVR